MDWTLFLQLVLSFVLVVFVGGGAVYALIQAWKEK